MRGRVEIALWMVMIAAPGLALAQAEGESEPIVACEVKGHDLILYNRGAGPLVAGTVVRWSAWNGKREGDHTLEEALEPFVGLELSGALGASYFWDRPCEAAILQPAG